MHNIVDVSHTVWNLDSIMGFFKVWKYGLVADGKEG